MTNTAHDRKGHVPISEHFCFVETIFEYYELFGEKNVLGRFELGFMVLVNSC